MKTKFALLGASCALLAGLASPAYAQDSGVTISTSFDVVTDYVFRGVSLADTAIQPGVELGAGDFYAGVWFSTGFGDTSAAAGDEVDLYAGYGFSLSDTVSADVGLTYYHYPQGGGLFSTNGGGSGTYEIYGGLAFDTALSPSVYAYYDFTLEAFTLEAGLGHSVALPDSDASFDLGLSAGLVDGDGFSYEYGQVSAALSKAVTDAASVYVGANFTVNSDAALNFKETLAGNPKDTLLWFGAGVSSSF